MRTRGATIGALFKAKREAAGLTQQEVAARAPVGVSTVSRLEIGESIPRAANLAKMALIVGITPEQLENFGEDAAADILRENLTEGQRSMRSALDMLVDAEVALTKLGYNVALSMPSDGVLVLRCEQDWPDSEDLTIKSALPAIPRREDVRQPP